MHELSVAHSLVELASAAAEEARATSVDEVHLVIGALSCVAPEALEFCFDLASRDTPLAGAVLKWRRLPVVIHCPVCREDVELPGIQRFRCPRCDTPSNDVRQGRELEIESLTVQVDDTPVAEGYARNDDDHRSTGAQPTGVEVS